MRRRRLWLGVGTALAVFAVLTGVGVSQAFWSTSGSVQGTITVKSGTAGLSVSGLNNLQLAFSGQSSVTSVITLQNTGSIPLGDLKVTITPSSTDSPNLASNLTVSIWPQPSGGCGTVPNTAQTGTWAAWPSDPFPQYDSPSTLAAGSAAVSYCVVTTWNGTTPTVTSSSGVSISPTVTVTAQTGGATGTQALSLAAYQPVGVATSQIGVTASSSTGAPSTVSQVGLYQASGDQSNEIDPTTGTIINTTNVCTTITVSGNNGSTPQAWQLTLDLSLPPYYGATLTNGSDFAYPNSSVPSAQIISHAAGSTVYVIGGVGDSTQPWGFNSSPVYYNASYPNAPVINNTPVTASQQALAQFCVTQSSTLYPVQQASASTYTVGTSRLADCNNLNNPPPLPQGPYGNADLCVVTTITGGYQHFFVGYTFNVAVGSLLASSSYNTCEQHWIESQTPGHWSLTSTGAPGTEADPGSNTSSYPYYVKSGSGSSTSFQVTSNGTQAPKGISNGQTVTSVAHYYSVPYEATC